MSHSDLRPLATRTFTLADQDWFAEVSRDRNPMHMDPVAARRTQYGMPVVHGIHALLWALDVLCASRPGLVAAGLQVRFVKPVLVGDTATAAISSEKPGDISLQVSVGGVACVTIRLTAAEPRGVPAEVPESSPTPLRDSARPLALDALPGCHGAFHFDGAATAVAFPAAAAVLGAGSVAGLAASTYVVGMECPGLHSIFGGLTAVLGGPVGDAPVRYGVAKFDERFRIMDIAVWAPGFNAKLSAYGRVPPVAQVGAEALRDIVGASGFAGQRALIVGGSRGLGEVTAKLLAVGGAEVTLTYTRGAADAERVVADIRAAGGRAEALAYDVRQPAGPQLAGLGLRANVLYYFATGPVFRRKLALYEPEVMREFMAFYVEGFVDLATTLQRRSGDAIVAFYPSTVAVDAPVPDLAEYAAAKLAGETLCHHLQAFAKGISTVISRLPRTSTDQTATVMAVESAEPMTVMLPILQEVQTKLRAAGVSG